MHKLMQKDAYFGLATEPEMVQYQAIMDFVTWDTAHSLSYKCACSFFTEEE